MFAKRNAKVVPSGAAYVNGIVASIIVVIAPFIPNQDIFWAFFSLNLFAFLVSYLPMFPSSLKLRAMDPDAERPYKVLVGNGFLSLLAWVPFVQLVLGAVLIVTIDETYLRMKGITDERADLSLLSSPDEDGA